MRAGSLLGLAGLLLGACSGASSGGFPEEVQCASPAPLPTSRSTPGAVSVQAYRSRVREGVATIERLRSDLHQKYPEDTFYRRESFRPDFARYADGTICMARGLKSLAAPDSRFESFDTALDRALDELVSHTEAGREAVRTRNVSEYRDWFAGVDEKLRTVHAVSVAQ